MATHNVSIHQNTSATKETSPYLGTYQPKDTVYAQKLLSDAAEHSGLTEIQCLTIFAGAIEAFTALEELGLVRIITDLGAICGEITGSLPTADAEVDATKNKLNLVLRLDEDLRNLLVNETPAILSDASITKVRIDNVMDLEVNKPYNVIHGCHRFRVAGFNMVLTDADATLYFTDKIGVMYPVTVDETISPQLIIAHSTNLLEGGDYKLVLKSRGGDAEGPLQTVTRSVKYLKVVDPAPAPILEKVQSADEEMDPNVMIQGSDGYVIGQNKSTIAGPM